MTPKTKRIVIAGLAAVIVFSFGKTGYHLINPPEVMLTRGEQATFEATLSNEKCKGLASDYEESKVDGYISYEYALTKMELCQAAVIGQYQFDAALKAYMKNALEREGLINTNTE